MYSLSYSRPKNLTGVGMQAGAATLENSMEEIELPYNPAIALLGIYTWDTGVLF